MLAAPQRGFKRYNGKEMEPLAGVERID